MENRQILVVENNQELSSVLVNQGYQVQITNSEAITLEVAKQTQPYLIILNTTMANFDAYHLCKKLKAEIEISDIPVLLCSEEQNSAALVKAFEAGANEYLTLPFVIEELKARINNQLNLAQRYRQLSQKNILLNLNTLEYFKSCLERLPLPAWICDAQGNYIFLNQAWLNFIGTNLRLLNKPWGEAIHPQDKTNSKTQYLKAYQDLDKFKIEYRLKNERGESRWFLDEGQPLFNLQGQFQGYIGFAVDITENKINEITLLETRDFLKKENNKLKLFTEIFEYLRNPINFEDLTQTVTSLLAKTLKINRCLLLSYDENLNPKVLPIAEYKDDGIQSALMCDFSIYNNYLSLPLLIEDKAYKCKDVYQDQNLESFQPLAVDLKIKSLLMVRTSYQDKINGLIILHQIDDFRDWSDEEIELVELVAKQLGIAIAHPKMVDSEKANSLAITKTHLQLQQEILDKQKIEQQLRDSEQRWQLAIKGTQDGIFDYDFKTGKVFYSDRWKSILGYEDQEIGNSHEEWLKRIHPDDFQRVMAADQAHFERKTPYFREEYRLRCKNGTYKWILGRCQAVWDEQGKPVLLLGCHTDITESKSIEQALKESENLYRQLIESQEGVMICRWLPDTSLTFVNECYAKFLGKSSQNLIGKSFYDCLSNRKGDKQLVDHLHSLFTEKLSKTIEDERVSSEGKTRYFRWLNQPILDAEGNLLEIQSHGIDISEAKVREKALSLIAEGAAYSTGEDFYKTSVKYVTELLQVQFSYVVEILEWDNQTRHNWILWDGKTYREDIQSSLCDLQGSPYEVTFNLGKYYVKDNLSNIHPQQSKIAEVSIVSYWGISLQGSKGNTLGLFGVMDSKPLEFSSEQETILRIFAARMGAELERQQSEQALKRRVQKEKLFSRISRYLLDEDFDTAINFAIKSIGEFFGGDRCYIFQYQPLGWLTMTHEWCNEGVSEKIDSFQHFDLESYGLLLEDFLTNDLLYIKDYQSVPDSFQKEKIFLRQKSIKSLLLVPMKHMGVTVGFIGLNTREKVLNLTKEDFENISFISNFLATVFESKTAENNLKASQQKLSFLVQQAPLAIIEMNHDKAIISWNPAAEDVFGYKDFEVINSNLIELLFPERLQEKITQLYRELFETRTRNYFVYENLTKEGNSIICQWYNTPLIDNENNLIGVASIAVNVTQQKRTEIALQQAKEAAESASKAKSNFLACMSHELRTPLISILGFSQLLREDFSLTVKQREHIQTIYRSGKHLLDLINNILSMYKIETGKIELEENRLDLPKILTSLQEMFTLKIKEKGIALVLEYEAGLPRFILTDEVKLRQVLINLLQNAIKFTNRGSVTLRVQLAEDLKNLYFEVEDTGIGIDPERISNLFTPFAQTFKNHKYSDGTGLGLAISRNYVRLMGSDIEVKSILGRGSVFSFKIPLKTQSQSYNGKSTLIQPNPKVLIVDHEDSNRQALIKLLETLPLELKEAVDAQEAIYFAQVWKPDLILMDMEMPGMDGYQATHLIKNQKTEKYPFVIALCDYSSEENSLAIAGVGCEDFITKPFTRQVLIDKISDYLGLSLCESGISSRETLFNYNTLEFKPLTKEDLTVMPSIWVRQLHLAAREINDQQLLDLIKQIPYHETALINGLTDLVKNFRVDLILELTK